jgi:hypothetical protein
MNMCNPSACELHVSLIIQPPEAGEHHLLIYHWFEYAPAAHFFATLFCRVEDSVGIEEKRATVTWIGFLIRDKLVEKITKSTKIPR